MQFKWNDWNEEHISKRSSPEEVQLVIHNARRPYPRSINDDKYLVWAPGIGGRLMQVIFVIDRRTHKTYPIHARPLSEREKRVYRRQKRNSQ